MDHHSPPPPKRHGLDRVVIISYMAASSAMLLVNKLIITDFPCPFFTLACQFGASAALARASGWWQGDESLEWSGRRALQFAPAAMAQVGTIYTGIKSLQYVNVESFITARASTPLLISVVEYVWLGHELPRGHSVACLLGMLVGSLFYGYHDVGEARGYLWLAVWYLAFCFDQTYLKKLLTQLGKDCSTIAGVFYTNLLGLVLVVAGGRVECVVSLMQPSPKTLALLCLSCLLGMALATTALESRKLTTPTQFAIIGNVCKLLTIAANWILWEHHCTPNALMGLLLSLLCAFYYRPSPMREGERPEEERARGVSKTCV